MQELMEVRGVEGDTGKCRGDTTYTPSLFTLFPHEVMAPGGEDLSYDHAGPLHTLQVLKDDGAALGMRDEEEEKMDRLFSLYRALQEGRHWTNTAPS